MKLPHGSYETLSEAMNKLKEKGFTYEFDYKDTSLYSSAENKEFKSSELKIVEVHRFEGITDPEDSSILYAVEAYDGSKGVVVDAYGMYADAEKTKFMSEIEIIDHNQDPANKEEF